MTPKPVDVLLIGADLREVLLCRREGQPAPLRFHVNVSSDSSTEYGYDSTGTLVCTELQRVMGLNVYPDDVHCVNGFKAMDGAGLYLAVANLNGFESGVAADAEWQRVPLHQAKSTEEGSEFVCLAPMFQAVDRSAPVSRILLESLLRHLSSEVKLDFVCWVHRQSGHVIFHVDEDIYCKDCCQAQVHELTQNHPEHSYRVGGGRPFEANALAECTSCGKVLLVNLTEPGVRYEVERLVARGINLEGKGADRLARQVLEILNTDSTHFDAVEHELWNMVRRGERSLTPAQLAHIPLDLAVACAARDGRTDLVLKALDAGGNPNAIEPESGTRAAHWACRHGNPGMLDILLSRGAIPEYPRSPRNDMAKQTVLHMAVRRVELLEVVLPHARDVNVRNGLGRTPLHMLCAEDNVTDQPEIAARLLLDAGADPYIKDNSNVTPMMLATTYGETDFSRFIRAYHASAVAKQAVEEVGRCDQPTMTSVRPLA